MGTHLPIKAWDTDDDQPSTRDINAALSIDYMGLPPYIQIEVEGTVLEVTLNDLFNAIAADTEASLNPVF